MTAIATSRIGARISPDLHRIFKRAAQIQGRSLTDFLITSAHEAAVRIIKENEIITLSAIDQKTISESIISPPKINKKMTNALEAYENLILD